MYLCYMENTVSDSAHRNNTICTAVAYN
jgi:hypothetical protein